MIEEECKYKVEEIETLRGLYRGKAKELEEKCENQAERVRTHIRKIASWKYWTPVLKRGLLQVTFVESSCAVH